MDDTEQIRVKEYMRELLAPAEPEEQYTNSPFWLLEFIGMIVGISFAIYLYFRFWIWIFSLII